MSKQVVVRLMTRLLACAVAAVILQGCTLGKYTSGEWGVGDYFKHRAKDACEIAEFGFTITKTPQLGLYWNSLEGIVFGYCDLDGYYVGLGGGQLGMTRVHAKCWGALYGEEEIGWGSLLDDPEHRDEAIIRRRSGFVGIATSILGVDITGNGYGQGPDYTPACVHFVPHIAYVGFVWNLRYTQMIDFVTGLFFLDIAGDDGKPKGSWFRMGGEEAAASRPASAEAGYVEEGVVSAKPAAEEGKGFDLNSAEQGFAPPKAKKQIPQTDETKGKKATASKTTPKVETAKAKVSHPAAESQKYKVKSGDCLTAISKKLYGDATKWRVIYDANRDKLSSPDKLVVGMVLAVPAKK